MASLARVSFSGDHLELTALARDHTDTEESVRSYFLSAPFQGTVRFAGYTMDEVRAEMEDLLSEHDRRSALALLAALEASFRIDYLQRCYRKEKDPLSRSLREIFALKKDRASLEEDILGAWKDYSNAPSARAIVQELRGALKYRHWLAHGRYWVPKLGQRYDYQGIYDLAQAVFTDFSLIDTP